jgi:hypothetical protein
MLARVLNNKSKELRHGLAPDWSNFTSNGSVARRIIIQEQQNDLE